MILKHERKYQVHLELDSLSLALRSALLLLLRFPFAFRGHYPTSPALPSSARAFGRRFNKGVVRTLARMNHNSGPSARAPSLSFWKPVKSKRPPQGHGAYGRARGALSPPLKSRRHQEQDHLQQKSMCSGEARCHLPVEETRCSLA